MSYVTLVLYDIVGQTYDIVGWQESRWWTWPSPVLAKHTALGWLLRRRLRKSLLRVLTGVVQTPELHVAASAGGRSQLAQRIRLVHIGSGKVLPHSSAAFAGADPSRPMWTVTGFGPRLPCWLFAGAYCRATSSTATTLSLTPWRLTADVQLCLMQIAASEYGYTRHRT
jgi:hypothetical protein